jgi:hypothetical protein
MHRFTVLLTSRRIQTRQTFRSSLTARIKKEDK